MVSIDKHTRILVFPCGSENGLELHRALSFARNITLFGASSVRNHGRYVYQNYIEGLPWVGADDFIDRLNETIDTLEIDFVIAAHDDAVLKLSEHEKKMSCQVIGSPVDTCRICRSKRETNRALVGVVRVPAVYQSVADIERFPVFMKPDVGQGSKGVYTAKSSDEVSFYLHLNTSLLIFEWLPGTEYTVDCFTDRHGSLLFAGCRTRKRTFGGISVDTYPVENPEITDMAHKINNTLSFRGPWFFQAKETEAREPAVTEVAPRIGGASGMQRALGVNLPLLGVYDRMGLDVEILQSVPSVRMDSALLPRFELPLKYTDVYLDLDDTVILQGKVNSLAMMFVYQCANNEVRVHLLTRNRGDLGDVLRTHHISPDVFASILHVDPDERKADLIPSNANAIFIDDSFKERKSVFNLRGIPVFSPDAIECLLDGRR